ncbi:MAG: hypothetical protein M1531_09180 [Chloroflexi bacterium]|nr:hypothetical protein [Chloroflexota bacterium]
MKSIRFLLILTALLVATAAACTSTDPQLEARVSAIETRQALRTVLDSYATPLPTARPPAPAPPPAPTTVLPLTPVSGDPTAIDWSKVLIISAEELPTLGTVAITYNYDQTWMRTVWIQRADWNEQGIKRAIADDQAQLAQEADLKGQTQKLLGR